MVRLHAHVFRHGHSKSCIKTTMAASMQLQRQVFTPHQLPCQPITTSQRRLKRGSILTRLSMSAHAHCSGTVASEPVFFWMPDDKPYGAFSHWYAAPTSNAEGTFVTVEHYMMFRKALLFKDSASAQKILASSNPQQAKAAGREVQDFDSHIWKQHRDRIVYEGNLMKFSQNPNLAALLLETGDRPLVEASPEDSLWGIGFSADNAASNRASWGENLCGKAIAHVRTTLRKA